MPPVCERRQNIHRISRHQLNSGLIVETVLPVPVVGNQGSHRDTQRFGHIGDAHGCGTLGSLSASGQGHVTYEHGNELLEGITRVICHKHDSVSRVFEIKF